MLKFYSDKKRGSHKLPYLGMRIIKSSLSVALCMIIFLLRNENGMPFYSALAALWCIREYSETTRNMALQRTIGTFIGAAYGLVFLLVMAQLPNVSVPGAYIAAAIMIIPIIYTTVFIKKTNASFFSCVVFLSITINHSFDTNPYFFVLNRVIDTLIGIAIGIIINDFHPPRRYHKDILFVSGIDSLLITSDNVMSPYNRTELNRIISHGANFTLSTVRTTASVINSMQGVRLKIPVIVMDGAALYDLENNKYLKAFYLDEALGKEIIDIIHSHGLHCFINTLFDNTLIIYYGDFTNRYEEDLYHKLCKSPYRNYTQAQYMNNHSDKILYLTVLAPCDEIRQIYYYLCENGYNTQLKITLDESPEYPECTYLKIFNKNACKDAMLEELKKLLNIEKSVTFGTIKGKYDILIDDDGNHSAVKMLKRLYEPYFWQKEQPTHKNTLDNRLLK